jgi:hypothetical protein
MRPSATTWDYEPDLLHVCTYSRSVIPEIGHRKGDISDVAQPFDDLVKGGFFEHFYIQQPEDQHFDMEDAFTLESRFVVSKALGSEDVLDWDVRIENLPIRSSSTYQVQFIQAGKKKPRIVDDSWD